LGCCFSDFLLLDFFREQKVVQKGASEFSRPHTQIPSIFFTVVSLKFSARHRIFIQRQSAEADGGNERNPISEGAAGKLASCRSLRNVRRVFDDVGIGGSDDGEKKLDNRTGFFPSPVCRLKNIAYFSQNFAWSRTVSHYAILCEMIRCFAKKKCNSHF